MSRNTLYGLNSEEVLIIPKEYSSSVQNFGSLKGDVSLKYGVSCML